MSRRPWALLVTGAALAAWAPASSPFEESAAARVAADVLEAKPSAGLTIAVARGGKTLFARGWGLAGVEERVAAAGDTVYPICSISKNFAAAAVLKLAEQGRVDRAAPAARYLPDVPGLSPEITVDALLDHSSGLGNYNEGDDWDGMAPRAIPPQEMVARIVSRPHSPPNHEWGYSNSAYYLAGLLVEKASGRSYWQFLRESFFGPLGMRHAGPCADVAPTSRARGYRVEKGGLVGAESENWKNPFAGGGLCMTAGDLLAWEAALDSGRALSDESVRAMRTPTRLAGGRKYDYGLGTRLGSLEGHRVLGHTGGGQGFSTVLMRFPDDDLTIVVLKNFAAGPSAGTIGGRLARQLLGLPAFQPSAAAPPPKLLAAVTGDWIGDDGPFRLAAHESRLRVEVPGGPTLDSPWMGGTAFTAGEDQVARFESVGGRIDRVAIYDSGLFESIAVRRKP